MMPPSKQSRTMMLREKLSEAFESSFTLQNVHVPIAVLPKELVDSAVATEEGFVLCHVAIENGKIESIEAADDTAAISDTSATATTIDCQRSILLPCFVDCHTHLDKSMTASRNRSKTGTVAEAWLEREPEDWKHWVNTPGDLIQRMDFAVRCALHHGTKAMRTHLDGYNTGDDHEFGDKLRNTVWDAFRTIQERYQDQITLQAVANLYLPLYQQLPEVARAHCERAKATPGTCLGAYIGNTADTPNEDTQGNFDAILKLAHEFALDIDLHIDETNDPKCCALKPLCKSLEKARAAGYQGKVVLGHCCALSLQDQETKTHVCQQLAKLGNVFVVANPFTNLSLQDRRGTHPPLGAKIPDQPCTPQWRGLTLMQELRAAGVSVATASDNVRDFWLSAGSDYDMLAVWSATQALCHLDTAPNEGSWANIVTSTPAQAMGLMKDSTAFLDEDQPADLILFPGARSASELFSRPHNDRLVLRNGEVSTTILPDYAELDELMEATSTKGAESKGEIEKLCQYLDIEIVDKRCVATHNAAAYTPVPHFYQLESWDCGVACLMMISKWLRFARESAESDGNTPNLLSPDDMQDRRNILNIMGTESIWTSDLVWMLHNWKNDYAKPIDFALASKNISEPESHYEDFEYYHNNFASDEERVRRTFQELRQQNVPMIQTKRFPFPTVLQVVLDYDDIVAILLVDNNTLLRRQKMHEAANDVGAVENLNNYVGHFVILCGTSTDPQHLKGAQNLAPKEHVQNFEQEFCCVLANPDPASYSPYMFVYPGHLEAAWRADGTDDDIIFVRRIR